MNTDIPKTCPHEIPYEQCPSVACKERLRSFIEPSLLPCPFCGGTPEITKHFKQELWQLIHRCEVMPTMVIDWRDTKQQIIQQWNTRQPIGWKGTTEKGAS